MQLLSSSLSLPRFKLWEALSKFSSLGSTSSINQGETPVNINIINATAWNIGILIICQDKYNVSGVKEKLILQRLEEEKVAFSSISALEPNLP